MSAGRRDFKGPLRRLLTSNVGQIDRGEPLGWSSVRACAIQLVDTQEMLNHLGQRSGSDNRETVNLRGKPTIFERRRTSRIPDWLAVPLIA